MAEYSSLAGYHESQMIPTASQGVGDVHSMAKGSGARFNTGKPPLDLIPLHLIAANYLEGSGVHEAVRVAASALQELGWFQGRSQIDSHLQGAINELLFRSGAWEECAQVLDYGRKKYSKRGDCTCNASDAIRMKSLTSTFTHTKVPTPGKPYEGCVNGVTTKISKSVIPDTESDKPPTIENGWKIQTTETKHGSVSASDPSNENWTQGTKSQVSTKRSDVSTDCHASNTIPLCLKAAAFAEASPNFTSTTATLTDRCDQLSAIPATLALDLSKGLETGLAAHLITCGVHQMPGQTGNWNWAKGMAWSIPIACAARHLLAMMNGEVLDPESGFPHRGHAMANLIMLLTYQDTFPEGDDRAPAGYLLPVAQAT